MRNKSTWQHSLGFTALALLIAALFDASTTIDIHIHDTYYIIATTHLLVATGGWLLLCWLVYQLLRKRRTAVPLTILHAMLSLLFVLVLFVVPLLFQSSQHSYADLSQFRNNQQKIVLAAAGFLLGQVLFLANVLVALMPRQNEQR